VGVVKGVRMRVYSHTPVPIFRQIHAVVVLYGATIMFKLYFAATTTKKKGLESSSKILSSSIIVEAPDLAHLLFEARLRKLLSSLQKGLPFFV
jgi:hypothetical protein